MAYFYGEVKGVGRTTDTRTGTKSSGIFAGVASERISAYVTISERDGVDILHVKVYIGNFFAGSVEKVLDKEITTDMVFVK